MLIILLLTFHSWLHTHGTAFNRSVHLNRLHWFSLLASCLCHFSIGCERTGLTKAPGRRLKTAARRGEETVCGTFKRQTQDFFFSLLSEDRKPNDFQHSVRLTKSCNIPSSQSVMKWSQSLPSGDVEREMNVLYLN